MTSAIHSALADSVSKALVRPGPTLRVGARVVHTSVPAAGIWWRLSTICGLRCRTPFAAVDMGHPISLEFSIRVAIAWAACLRNALLFHQSEACLIKPVPPIPVLQPGKKPAKRLRKAARV